MTAPPETALVRFDREDNAQRVAAALNCEHVRAYVLGPYPVTRWGEEADGLEWVVVVHVPVRKVVRAWMEPDPMDGDEATDYVDSHWDREAEDREYGTRRGWHEHY